VFPARLRRLLPVVLVPLVLALGLSGSATAVSSNIVISQVYGGGGNSGAPLRNDFIEIFNLGSQTVELTGWTLQYTSATGTGNLGANNGQLSELSGELAPGQYLVVKEASQAAVGEDFTADITDPTPIAMAAGAGKVALVDSPEPLGCNGGSTACTPEALARIVDLVGYGGANFFEGAPAPTLSNSTAAFRAADGCTDTDNNAADFASGTPAPRNRSTTLNPCGVVEDDAPTVSSTSPGDGASNVPAGSNVEITFSESVSVSGSWFTISCTASGSHTATVSGGPTTFTLNPDADFTPGESCAVTISAAQVADTDTNDPPDAMAADHSFTFGVGDPCAEPFTSIPAIQGNGPAAAITGNVTTEGVVVGEFEGPTSAGLQGFYLQDAAGDGNAATSDGIFVFTGNNLNGISNGDLLRVSGFARERFNQTALNGTNSNTAPVTDIVDCGTGSVAPTEVHMPFASTTFAERFEGMLVKLPQPLVISEYFNYDRFGEIVLGLPLPGEDRHFTPTSVVEPGAPAQARLAEYLVRRITLDDGLGNENPSFTRHPNGQGFSLTNSFRGGDTVTDTVGVLGFDFSLYRIQPTAPATYTAVNERPGPLEAPEGIRVAAMNTLNFFLTLDTTASDSGPGPCGGNQNLDCRGADSNQPDEFTRQRTKLVEALAGLGSDVIGLNELENTPGVDPLSDPNGLVPGLNAKLGAGTYDAIDTGPIGTDAIKVGLIYKPGVVTPVGPHKILTSAVDPRFIDTLSRPVLAQTFQVNATGARFTVAVNHLKSKGSACAGDPDTGDGQGNCNLTRKAAAEALVDWLATDPTGSSDPDFLIIGDLNSYAKEDPIDEILAGSDDAAGTADDYVNLIQKYEGEHAYSFVFDGMAGYLDHGLANGTLAAQVLGATEWHINADEPDLVDYDTSFKSATQDTFYEPNHFRSADHDPLVVTLCEDLSACAADSLEQWIAVLEVLIEQSDGKAQDKLEDVLAKAEAALEKLEDGDRKGAAGELEGAAGDLEQAVRKGDAPFAVGTVLLQDLGAIARLLAVDAIEEAKARGGSASKIGQAERQLARGDERLAAGRYKEGIARYTTAISQAEGA
jgi:uncharacterized protein